MRPLLPAAHLPLGGRHDHQQFFRSNLFEFIIACIHQLHVQLRRQQIVTQRFGDAAGVAGLRGGNQRDRGTSAAWAGTATAAPDC
jgi:hypothetical protein